MAAALHDIASTHAHKQELEGNASMRAIWPFRLSFLFSMILPLIASDVAQAGDIEVVHARVTPSELAGVDVHLQMTVINRSSVPDALLCVRCPVANFSEKYTIDSGEGSSALHAIPSLAIDADDKTRLVAENAHVMRSQTRQPLIEQDRFVCSANFRKAGRATSPSA
jgi:periplasmic copper chaperone A